MKKIKSEGRIGNRNAEKWTEEVLLELLPKMLSFAVENNAYAIATVMVEFDLYVEWWSLTTKKFKDNKLVSQAIKDVEGAIESNIINNTMNGTAKSAAMAIFLLKNKFDYKDKVESDITTGGESFNLKDLVKFE